MTFLFGSVRENDLNSSGINYDYKKCKHYILNGEITAKTEIKILSCMKINTTKSRGLNIYSYEKLIHLKSKNSDIIDYMRIIYIITKPLPYYSESTICISNKQYLIFPYFILKWIFRLLGELTHNDLSSKNIINNDKNFFYIDRKFSLNCGSFLIISLTENFRKIQLIKRDNSKSLSSISKVRSSKVILHPIWNFVRNINIKDYNYVNLRSSVMYINIFCIKSLNSPVELHIKANVENNSQQRYVENNDENNKKIRRVPSLNIPVILIPMILQRSNIKNLKREHVPGNFVVVESSTKNGTTSGTVAYHSTGLIYANGSVVAYAQVINEIMSLRFFSHLGSDGECTLEVNFSMTHYRYIPNETNKYNTTEELNKKILKVYKLIVPSTFEETNNNSYIENPNKKIDNSKVNFFESLDNSEPNYTSYAFNSGSQNSN
ncbi:hypothetical protein U3516DRAFT_737504 [Neocallimastix sp. 'constans']